MPKHQKLGIEAELNELQRESFNYYLYEINPINGLVMDKTADNWPVSIAVVGLIERVLNRYIFFWIRK